MVKKQSDFSPPPEYRDFRVAGGTALNAYDAGRGCVNDANHQFPLLVCGAHFAHRTNQLQGLEAGFRMPASNKG